MALKGYKHLSDIELRVLLKEGNQSAYTEIYQRYSYLMFVFSLKKLRDEDLAKDFVQDLFLNLWNKKESLSEDGKLSSFLYTTIRNKMLDYFAHQKTQNKYLEFLANYHLANEEKTDHLIREKELSNYIEREIQALPKKMRTIFELSRKEHLNRKQIANELETSEHNVAKQITNALRILRTKLVESFS